MSLVYDADAPDPFVLRAGGSYYAFTTQTGSTNVPVLESADLRHWTPRGDALPHLPAWAVGGHTWSPAVLRRGDGFLLFYAVRERGRGRQAVSVAVTSSFSPLGPFADDSSRPLVYQWFRGGSIDPEPFVDADESAYLVWKSDENAVGRAPRLWSRRLAADGRAFAGRPTRLLRQDAAWEAPVIEAPSLLRFGQAYLLFYSGGWWESAGYGIGYAVGAAPEGPFRKVTADRPWLATDGGVAGPGGQSFFADGAGQIYLAYHGWAPGQVGYAAGGRRALHIDQVDVDGDRPVRVPEW